jgi:hypothetical protein
LTCKICSRPLSLVLQSDDPLECTFPFPTCVRACVLMLVALPDFDRLVYVFGCNNAECDNAEGRYVASLQSSLTVAESGSWLALRAQKKCEADVPVGSGVDALTKAESPPLPTAPSKVSLTLFRSLMLSISLSRFFTDTHARARAHTLCVLCVRLS